MSATENNTFFMVGAGRVGWGLTRRLLDAGLFARGLWGPPDHPPRPPAGAPDIPLFSGHPPPAAIAQADYVLLAVPDGVIDEMGRRLAAAGHLHPGQVLLHLSGCQSYEILAPAKATGALLASLHPLAAFADPATPPRLAGAYCVLEGEPAALPRVEALVHRLHAIPVCLTPGTKALYHAGAAAASNLVVALLAMAADLLGGAGIERELALQMLTPLARGAIDNVAHLGTVHGLTGPIARGDAATVECHLAALHDRPEAATIYRRLSWKALELARAQRGPRDPALRLLQALLAQDW